MNRKKVLIIDDEVDFCLLMQFYLTNKNCDVRFSHTLKAGMLEVRNNIPDIIIIDNNLPDGLGWTAAELISKDAPDANVFLISASKPSGNYTPLLPHFQIIEKPISISQIDNLVH